MEEPPSDEYASSDESFSSARPNKYLGPSSTWHSYIENERALTSSILQQRDQDLALHLYNAHALKSCHYKPAKFDAAKPWASKVRMWQKHGWHVEQG